jgi:predicted DNA-binding transcriptional regulator AlpA
MSQIPEQGFLRLSQIIGNPKAGIAPIIPVKKSTWWAGVKSGRYPAAVKIGPGCTAWSSASIRNLIKELNNPEVIN